MEFDEKEIFESFENEFNRKEKSKRPGNRFPAWIVPILIILAGAAYYGFASDRFSGIFNPTTDVESLAVTAETTPDGITAETMSALEATVTGVSTVSVVMPATESAAAESMNGVLNVDAPIESFATTSESGAGSLETEPIASIDPTVPQTEPTEMLPTATARPSIWERLTGLVRRHPTETAVPVEMPLPTVQSSGGTSEPVEIPLPTVQSSGATSAPVEMPLPTSPTVYTQPTTSPTVLYTAPTDALIADDFVPVPLDVKTAATATVFSAEPMPAVTQINDEEIIVLGAPTQPIEASVMPVTVLNPVPSATITLELPATATLVPEPTETFFPTETPVPSETPPPTLTPTPTEEPGFFERIGAFFFGDDETATPTPTLDPAVPFVPTATPKPGIIKRINIFFFGDDPTATPMPTLDPAVPFVPTETPKPGFFAPVVSFFFPPTETPVPSAAPIFDVTENPVEPTSVVLTVEVSINSGVQREVLTSKDGSEPVSDFNDEPVFQDGEPFYLPTSDISNPPTLMPSNGQAGQAQPAAPSQPQTLNTVSAPNIGLPLVTQAIPTQPIVRAPAQPTRTVVVNPQFAPPNPNAGVNHPAATFSPNNSTASRGPAGENGIIIGYEPNGAPIYAPGYAPQALPTALPNTGFGNNGSLPRYAALLALLLAVIAGARYLRGRNAKK